MLEYATFSSVLDTPDAFAGAMHSSHAPEEAHYRTNHYLAPHPAAASGGLSLDFSNANTTHPTFSQQFDNNTPDGTGGNTFEFSFSPRHFYLEIPTTFGMMTSETPTSFAGTSHVQTSSTMMVSNTQPFEELVPPISQEEYVSDDSMQNNFIGRDIGLCQDYDLTNFTLPPSVQPESWAGPAPRHSGLEADSNPAQGSVAIGAEHVTVTNSDTGNMQASAAARQLVGLDPERCESGSPAAQVQESWDSPPELVRDEGTPEKEHRDASEYTMTTNGLPRKRGVKMHKCSKCDKKFPRPSGLRTHMNTHTGDRPFGCSFCDRTFTVQSNAKRHLKGVHHIDPSTIRSDMPQFVVNFDNPIIHTVGTRLRNPKRIRWIPTSLGSYKNTGKLDSRSSSEDDYDDNNDIIIATSNTLPQAVSPSEDGSEARSTYDSDESAGHPYHPSQWNGMPGRAI